MVNFYYICARNLNIGMANNWFFILCCVFLVAWLCQIVLQLTLWQSPLRKLKRLKREGLPDYEDFGSGAFTGAVSVIVYAKNHCDQLRELLEALLVQNYPDYEVIVVNDDSVDETIDVLTAYSIRYPNFTYTQIGNKVRSISHRKLALLLGVKKAKGDYILTTNAHCLPAGPNWISCMVRQFRDRNAEVVVGPICYGEKSGAFYRFDQFRRMRALLGVSLMNCQYAAWSQNMAFTKEAFWRYEKEAALKFLNLAPGEDDIFVSCISNGYNVQVECSAEATILECEDPVRPFWSIDRATRAFTSKYCKKLPLFWNFLDAVTRYLTVLAGLCIVGWTAWNMMWVEFGISLFLLLVRIGLIVYSDVSLAKALQVKVPAIAGLLLDLIMPLVDLWFCIKASWKSERFLANKCNAY